MRSQNRLAPSPSSRTMFIALILPLLSPVNGFAPIQQQHVHVHNINFSGESSSRHSGTTTLLRYSARDLLYQDQQQAMERRALFEQTLLERKKSKELKAPKIRVKDVSSGTGFGGGASVVDPKVAMGMQQAKIVHRDGVLRIDRAMSAELADQFREHILNEQALAEAQTQNDLNLSQAYYGVENQRKSRCDLQLSLLRGGDHAVDGNESKNNIVADVLQELLGKEGTLRPAYEQLVTLQGEFYELAAVITNPGSSRQKVHPDLPFKDPAPLYVIFLALQDVSEAMGPTTFLVGSHTKKENVIFNDISQEAKDAQLANSNPVLATLKKGDAVLFDARTLHCGNANDGENGATRVLFNFSFRNPDIAGDLGYKGSIRPGYEKAMNLNDVSEALLAYEGGDTDPFAKYGDGMQRMR